MLPIYQNSVPNIISINRETPLPCSNSEAHRGDGQNAIEGEAAESEKCDTDYTGIHSTPVANIDTDVHQPH